jgi:NTP pyrophosphatase (non-canonical NTP hydrolase)
VTKPDMTYDEAVAIAHGADQMSLELLMRKYEQFNAMTENTPDWMNSSGDYNGFAKPMGFQMLLHASLGLVTESAEIADAIKKDLYGKNRAVKTDNIVEELGDMLYYMVLAIRALREMGMKIELRDVLKDNVKKLANRYIEKFGR